MSELVSTRICSTAAKLSRPELAVRDDCRFHQGPRLSRLSHHKVLGDHDFSFQPWLGSRNVEDLATLSFVEAKFNAAFLGPPGVGG